jgi:hypothetical protein
LTQQVRMRLKASDRQRRHIARPGVREHRRQVTSKWKMAHRANVRRYNRWYRIRVLGRICFFCGRPGSYQSRLCGVTRMVPVNGELGLAKVWACRFCRG